MSKYFVPVSYIQGGDSVFKNNGAHNLHFFNYVGYTGV